ncbi:hypothetical protein [Streptomyces sp. PD-S100-1]|uniref:hypothetical protein n=1 Tax=unclassified Streptomyces TaxID=2593676 RepID=UPI0039BD8A22
MPIPAFGGLPVLGAHPLQTVACGTDSRKEVMITLAVVSACVINGDTDTMTDVLRQATWLVVAVIILTVVQAVVSYLPQQRVNPAVVPDISG